MINNFRIVIAKSLCFSKNTRRPPCISWFKRRKPGLFGYIIVFLLITSLTGCDDTIWIWDSKETQKAKQAKFEQERNKEMKLALSKFEYLFKNESDEFIALLSIKYTLNIDLTHKIIDEFVQKDLSISDIETISDHYCPIKIMFVAMVHHERFVVVPV